MKRIIAFFTLLIAFFSNLTVQAQENTGNEYHSLLWRISGKGLDKPSYLFGTMHLICADDFIWTSKMRESLEKSKKVCFEMDLDDPKTMMDVAAGMMDKDGKKLSSYF